MICKKGEVIVDFQIVLVASVVWRFIIPSRQGAFCGCDEIPEVLVGCDEGSELAEEVVSAGMGGL